jgi:hypothetical protein
MGVLSRNEEKKRVVRPFMSGAGPDQPIFTFVSVRNAYSGIGKFSGAGP